LNFMRNKRALINWFLSPQVTGLDMSKYDIGKLSGLISNQFNQIPVKKNNNNFKNQLFVPKLDLSKLENDNYKSILKTIESKIISCEGDYIKHFLLHGSLASNDYVDDWSDLDTWVVLNDSKLKLVKDLEFLFYFFKDLNNHIFEIDPLAHHGFITLLESDLYNYGNDIMPIEVLREAKSFIGDDNIGYDMKDTSKLEIKRLLHIKKLFLNFNSKGIFESHAKNDRYLTIDMINNNIGMYQLKYIISLIASIPSLYLSSINKPVYKRDSFKNFTAEFGKFKILEKVTYIRDNFHKYNYSFNSDNKIPYEIITTLGDNWISESIVLLNKITCNFYE